MEIGAGANAKQCPDRTAVVFGDVRYTWREWNGRINQLAHALRALGLGRGDKVAVMLHNCHQILEVGQAAVEDRARDGADQLSPARPRDPVHRRQLRRARADRRRRVPARDRAGPRRDARGIVAGGHILVGDAARGAPFRDYEAVLAAQPTADPTDLAPPGINSMVYTSGTTGRPKGVYRPGGIDPKVILGDRAGLRSADGQRGPHRAGAALPQRAGARRPADHRARRHARHHGQVRSRASSSRSTERERVTSSFVVPTIVKRILALPDEVKRRYDLSSLRSLIVGAAPFPRRDQEGRHRLLRRLPLRVLRLDRRRPQHDPAAVRAARPPGELRQARRRQRHPDPRRRGQRAARPARSATSTSPTRS